MTHRHNEGERAAWLTLGGNILLAALKLVIGLVSGSMVVVSDALHSASDALSTVFVILGLRIAQQPPDEKHPYGHSRAETIAAKLVALILIAVGANFAYAAIRAIIQGTYVEPGIEALWISILAIAAKEGMYRYTLAVGQKLGSTALLADAWHHRSDALSSIAAVIGVFFARLGWPVLDPLMAIVVAFIIIRVGWGILSSTIDELMDAQIDAKMIDEIKDIVINTDGVFHAKNLKVHKYGSEYHADLTITVASHIDVGKAHNISHLVEQEVLKSIPSITHFDIHVEPLATQES